MVRVWMTAALLAAGMTLANAEDAAKPAPHHHAKTTAAPAAPAADEAQLPEQVRGWFEGTVGNILDGVDVDDARTRPAAK